MSTRIGTVTYKDTPDARSRFAELGLDTNYEDTFNITLNGTDMNGDKVFPKYIQVDNFDNIAAVQVTINGIKNTVAPYTRTTFEIAGYTPDISIFAYEGTVKVYISETKLGIGDGTNDLAKDNAFNMGTYFQRDGGVSMLADFDAGGFLLRNVASPVLGTDAINLSSLQISRDLNFNDLIALDIFKMRPGVTSIFPADRLGAEFIPYKGAIDLAANQPDGKNYWWFADKAGNKFVLNFNKPFSITALGAKGDGATDCNIYFERASGFSVALGQKVMLVPAGTYILNNYWGNVSGLSVIGEGSTSTIIEVKTYNTGSMFMTGNGPVFSGFTKRYKVQPGNRGNGDVTAHGIVAYNCSNFTIRDVVIDGSPNSGTLIYGAVGGLIDNCRLNNLEADGFHITNCYGNLPSKDITVRHCLATDCGDDHFPVVSYTQNGAKNSNIKFIDCHSRGGKARGFVAAGVDGCEFISCTENGSPVCGLLITSDGTNGGTDANFNVTVRDFITRGSGGPNYGAISIVPLSDRNAENILFERVTIIDSKNEGIHAFGNNGARIVNIVLRDVFVNGAFYTGITMDNCTDLRVEDSRFAKTRGEAILARDLKGSIRVTNNDWIGVGCAGTNECTLQGTGVGVRTISDNLSRIGAPRVAEGAASLEFIKTNIGGADAARNYSEYGKVPNIA